MGGGREGDEQALLASTLHSVASYAWRAVQASPSLLLPSSRDCSPCANGIANQLGNNNNNNVAISVVAITAPVSD